jgi:cysteinyl-tRNA synthetase
MSLYKEFSELLPYLQSVRKIKTHLSFDVNFPKNWKLPKKYVQEDKVMEHQSQNPDERLISFVSEINEIEVELTSKNIKNVISYNLEREQKERLFNEKVEELKGLFEKQTLKNLQSLKFDVKVKKIELEDGEEELRTTGVVEK